MEQLYDVVIVGGGPAGLTAALYLARAQFRVVVLEKEAFGGQIVITHEVVNYPGIAKTDGRSLADTMRQQAEHFGAEFLLAEVRGFDLAGDVKTVRTDQGERRCLGVLLATGAQPRSVGFRGEAEYKGRGVAYCATCDGEFFTGKEVFVVGGGYAAAEESVFLTKFARHVTILVRKGDFSCAASVAQQARDHEKITVLYHTQLEEVAGRGGLTYARYKNTATGEVTEYRSEEPFGVFVLAGYAPDTEVLRGVVALDEGGYIITDATQKTSREGVYAAGDVCIKPLRQVVTATADGALAATQLEKYVAAVQRRTGLRPQAPARKQEASAGGLSAEMRRQLEALFENMQEQLVLKLSLDDRPVSAELEQLVTDLGRITDKLTVTADGEEQDAPCVEVCRADGTPTGLAFHGVPGGHEFSSFVLGLYNAAGPGQPLEDADRARMEAIQEPVELQILVTLSCTLCPELVVAAQRIATVNPRVKAHVYDLRHFDALKERHGIMSVPCLVVNGERVFFGKKNLRELLQLLGV